eukprot:TRINITY_DN7583_c0_g1_i1.p1 TRINITY_DN7583_c0_g1~~TRINITY_DN7583_c0_g1_i1.p1  ORF type:complete len:520 (+),score=135.04 TRINITY_DN7583_c0_g1_i1:41-1600(+)
MGSCCSKNGYVVHHNRRLSLRELHRPQSLPSVKVSGNATAPPPSRTTSPGHGSDYGYILIHEQDVPAEPPVPVLQGNESKLIMKTTSRAVVLDSESKGFELTKNQEQQQHSVHFVATATNVSSPVEENINPDSDEPPQKRPLMAQTSSTTQKLKFTKFSSNASSGGGDALENKRSSVASTSTPTTRLSMTKGNGFSSTSSGSGVASIEPSNEIMKQLVHRGIVDYAKVTARLADDNASAVGSPRSPGSDSHSTPEEKKEERRPTFHIDGIPMRDRKAKDLLLGWSKLGTAGYPTFPEKGIRGFSKNEWKTGVALCSILHYYRPDLIDFGLVDLTASEAAYRNNLELAFAVASKEFEIPIVLPVDTFLASPDQNQIISQVWEFFQKLSQFEPKGTAPSALDLAVSAKRASRSSASSMAGNSRTASVIGDGVFLPTKVPSEKHAQPEVILAAPEQVPASDTDTNKCYKCLEVLREDEDISEVNPEIRLHLRCFTCYKCGKKFKNARSVIQVGPDLLCDGCV